MTTKVKQTETYKDSQGEHIVCKGKLVLIKEFNAKIEQPNQLVLIENKVYKPIIISETEDIGYKDNYLFINNNTICNANYDETSIKHVNQLKSAGMALKVLVLPENFSPKHLQAIVNGKLKDGDEVYIECYNHGEVCGSKESLFLIKTTSNPNNHIKLFPVKKEESWDDNWATFTKTGAYKDALDPSEVLAWYKRFLKQNYNPPTSIKIKTLTLN